MATVVSAGRSVNSPIVLCRTPFIFWLEMRQGKLGRPLMTTDREEHIRQLAHAIWEREGHPHGRDAEHWRLATEAYEAEMAGSRVDDAGQPIEAGPIGPEQQTMVPTTFASPRGHKAVPPNASKPNTPRKRRTKAEMELAQSAEVVAPKARRGRKPREEAPSLVAETPPIAKRTRRTKAEMAAAAGAAGAAAAVVAAVTVTKRRRGPKADTEREAALAPTADVALQRPRKPKAVLSETEPTFAGVPTDATLGAVPDPSGDRPADLTTDLVPDPGAELPSGAAAETLSESVPNAGSAGERVPDEGV
jgi:hypothetical protein